MKVRLPETTGNPIEISDKILEEINKTDIKSEMFFPITVLTCYEIQTTIEVFADWNDVDDITQKRGDLVSISMKKLVKTNRMSMLLYNQYFDYDNGQLGMQIWTEPAIRG